MIVQDRVHRIRPVCSGDPEPIYITNTSTEVLDKQAVLWAATPQEAEELADLCCKVGTICYLCMPKQQISLSMHVMKKDIHGLFSDETAAGMKNLYHKAAAETMVIETELQHRAAREIRAVQQQREPIHTLKLIPETIPFPLTEVEKLVLQHLLDGHDTYETAEKMYYAEQTVQTYISRLIAKMEVESRTQLVLKVIKENWVERV
ncbi:helix-turn-helix transcriptional regulator [Alkalicoccus chagannorensis]|uniref:helix-turn-helix transcriptional regulator n=1 Tax=Alkalicoccus chagannorensis TaxID=427072 RepID=UPI000A03A605|nr:LuxR C-terminal-related transcriptional regulator [Alkalicoccus chagannorensis]